MGRTVFKTKLESELVTFKEKTHRGLFINESETPYSVIFTDDYPDIGLKLKELKPGDKLIIQYYTFNNRNNIIDFIKL